MSEGNPSGHEMESEPAAPQSAAQPRWKPLSATDRRVVGVLVEKAKTTPDVYPMSLAALRSGCNQKNNRAPLMELEAEDIEAALARLRAAGAVAEVQGGGRVSRFRHHLYDWLGVDKFELAVMAELLLRGAQTEGELRGRAARMEPIADLAALRPILDSLKRKGLVIPLTPAGRGHVLSHALYQDQELEKVRAQFAGGYSDHEPDAERAAAPEGGRERHDAAHTGRGSSSSGGGGNSGVSAALAEEVEVLKNQVAELRKDLDKLWSQVNS